MRIKVLLQLDEKIGKHSDTYLWHGDTNEQSLSSINLQNFWDSTPLRCQKMGWPRCRRRGQKGKLRTDTISWRPVEEFDTGSMRTCASQGTTVLYLNEKLWCPSPALLSTAFLVSLGALVWYCIKPAQTPTHSVSVNASHFTTGKTEAVRHLRFLGIYADC